MRYRRDKCCFRRIQLFKLRDVFQYNYVPQFFGFFTVVIRVVYFYIGGFEVTFFIVGIYFDRLFLRIGRNQFSY